MCCCVAENLRNNLCVPTLRFVLFLYVQHIHKISLRASLVSGTDEYPLLLMFLLVIVLSIDCLQLDYENLWMTLHSILHFTDYKLVFSCLLWHSVLLISIKMCQHGIARIEVHRLWNHSRSGMNAVIALSFVLSMTTGSRHSIMCYMASSKRQPSQYHVLLGKFEQPAVTVSCVIWQVRTASRHSAICSFLGVSSTLFCSQWFTLGLYCYVNDLSTLFQLWI